MLSDTTGRRITGLREREDMTLDELAAKIGINATTLGRIEKGQTQKINSDVLVALAREFSVSTDFLLGLPLRVLNLSQSHASFLAAWP